MDDMNKDDMSKKEDFNFFKSCDYEMVNTFLKFNKIIIKQEYNTLTLDKSIR